MRARKAAGPLLIAAVMTGAACARTDAGALLEARLAELSTLERASLVVGSEAVADGEAARLWLLHASPSLSSGASPVERQIRSLGRDGGLVGVVPFSHLRGLHRWDLARLQAVEEPWVDRLRGAGARVLVLPPLALPAVTGDTLPLTSSPAAVSWARGGLGWEGPLAALVETPGQAVAALTAGFDLVLGPDPRGLVAAIAEAAESGRLPPARLAAAAGRRLAADPQGGLVGVLRVERATPARGPPGAPAARSAPVLRPQPPAAVGMSEPLLGRADSLLLAAVREGTIPGAALVVARRGGVVRARGYGHLDPGDTTRTVDVRETIYDLASLTKVLGTTLAAMLLLEDGRISLDDPLRRWLPGFRGPDRDGVTLRHLLLHTSGLPAGLNVHGSAASPDDAVRRITGVRMLAPPGEVVLYSDLGMILLAEALARAAEEPLDRFLARRVFAPLGLGSTMFMPPLALRPWTAPAADAAAHEFPLHAIVHDGNALRLGGVAGHAGLFSTALETAVLAQLILNGGCYGEICLLAPATVRDFTVAQAETRALGWDTPAERSSSGSYFSEHSFGHTGYTGTSIWMDPRRELLVVLLTNRTLVETTNARMLRLRQEVHDAVARAVSDVPATLRPGAEPPPAPPRRRRR